jgi:hypothetical protein
LENITTGWERVHYEELRDFYILRNITTLIKLRRTYGRGRKCGSYGGKDTCRGYDGGNLKERTTWKT